MQMWPCEKKNNKHLVKTCPIKFKQSSLNTTSSCVLMKQLFMCCYAVFPAVFLVFNNGIAVQYLSHEKALLFF